MSLFEEEISILLPPSTPTEDAVYKEQTVIKRRPLTKVVADLNRVLSKGLPLGAVDSVIESVILGEQWKWFYEHVYYLNDLDTFNKQAPEVDSEGVKLDKQPVEPVEPIQPVILTVSEYKEQNSELFVSYDKVQGMQYGGHQVSLTESNQNGLTALQAAITMSDEIQETMFPFNFNAETANGNVMLPLMSITDFKSFAFQFMSARQQFFK